MSDTVEPAAPGDCLFVQLTADKLARFMLGDVRVKPSEEEIASAQRLIDRTGTLYRMVAYFRIDEWQKKPDASTET